MNEVMFGKMGNELLAPVLFSLPGGFLVIVPAVDVYLEDRSILDSWIDMTTCSGENGEIARKSSRRKIR